MAFLLYNTAVNKVDVFDFFSKETRQERDAKTHEYAVVCVTRVGV